MASPVAHRPFVEAGQIRDVRPSLVFGDAAPSLANDQRDLPFIVELFRFPGTDDRPGMADERTGRTLEQAGIFRQTGAIPVLGIPVGITDPDLPCAMR